MNYAQALKNKKETEVTQVTNSFERQKPFQKTFKRNRKRAKPKTVPVISSFVDNCISISDTRFNLISIDVNRNKLIIPRKLRVVQNKTTGWRPSWMPEPKAESLINASASIDALVQKHLNKLDFEDGIVTGEQDLSSLWDMFNDTDIRQCIYNSLFFTEEVEGRSQVPKFFKFLPMSVPVVDNRYRNKKVITRSELHLRADRIRVVGYQGVLWSLCVNGSNDIRSIIRTKAGSVIFKRLFPGASCADATIICMLLAPGNIRFNGDQFLFTNVAILAGKMRCYVYKNTGSDGRDVLCSGVFEGKVLPILTERHRKHLIDILGLSMDVINICVDGMYACHQMLIDGKVAEYNLFDY